MITFTDHALRKMEQRRLKKAWVIKTVKKPDYLLSSRNNRKIAYKLIGELYLAVIHTTEDEETIIITSHWEKGFRPKKEK